MYWSYPYSTISSPPYSSQHPTRNAMVERPFTEDLWQANIGRRITVHMTYDASTEWRDQVFTGTLMDVGRDYFIIREETKFQNAPLVLLNINLDYMIFPDGKINIPKGPFPSQS